MIEIKDKKACSGCMACKSICPRGAITMIEDEEGFLYPSIQKELCIQCNLCEKVCPIIHKKEQKKTPKAYLVRTKDNYILKNTSSGGFISSFSKHILKEKGIVFGAVFDKDFSVIHKKIEKEKDLEKLFGSKYVQSNIGNTYQECKKALEEKKQVLFIGTPCQIEGLKSYLKKDYDNLFTIDFVCHGVPSPKTWKEYKKYLEEKYNSKIVKVNFRSKDLGYRSTRMKIEFENKKVYEATSRRDMYLKSFYRDMLNRPSCSKCKFKTLSHKSDFTAFDCWEPTKVKETMKDDNKGYTALLCHSKKGEEYLKKIKEECIIEEVELEKLLPTPNGGMLLNSAKENEKRNLFSKDAEKNSILFSLKTYCKPSKKDIFLESSKKILKRVGLMNFLSSISVKQKRRRREKYDKT